MHVVAPDPARHLQPVSKMVSDEFAGGEHVEEIGRKYFRDCHYDWDVSRLIWVDETLVHHWGVWGYDMRLGPVQLRCAGVGAVVTREDHRRQGLMRRAAQGSLGAMFDQGYDVSILRGRHYAKYGYVRAWNYVTYRLAVSEVQGSHPTAYRPLGPDWMDRINDLYNREHAHYAGTAVRPTYAMLDAEDMQAYGWFDADQRLAGYVRAVQLEEERELQCLEATGDTGQVLALLSDLAAKSGFETLSFFTIPYHHPLLQFLRRGEVLVEEKYFEPSGWRIRLVNVASVFQKLLPLIEARVRRSRFADWQGILRLDGEPASAVLEFDRGQVALTGSRTSAHVLSAGSSLARLVIGSDHPREVLGQANGHSTGVGEELAEVIFPRMHPVLSHWDEF